MPKVGVRVRWTQQLENRKRKRYSVSWLKVAAGGPALSPAFLCCPVVWAVVKPEVLQKATVELLDQSLCSSLYGHSLTDRMVCAGYLDGKVDSCQVGCQGQTVTLCPLPPENKQVDTSWNKPALRRWKQEDQEFKAILGFTVSYWIN